MNQESKRPIALEDLLRLKRAERPAPEFWDTFDRELRAKQLAALVEKRPWWRSVPRALSSFARFHLPVGASAILAVTYIATRDFRSPTPAPQEISAKVSNEPAAPETAAVNNTVAVATPSVAPMGTTLSEAPAAIAAETLASTNTTAVAANEDVEAAAPERQVRDTPSSRFIAENLKAAQAAAPAITRGLLSRAHAFEIRGVTARANVEPLSQMTTPADARRAKFNSAMAVSFMADAGSRTSERVANRLSDDRLYDHVSRFGANGDRLQMKF